MSFARHPAGEALDCRTIALARGYRVKPFGRIACLAALISFGAVADNEARLPEGFADLDTDVQAVILEYLFSNQASQVWGEQAVVPTAHEMVKYLDDFQTRVLIDFERGNIRVESLGSSQPEAALEHAIAAILLTPANPEAVDLFTASDFGITGRPFLAGQVLDHEGKAIEYPWRAERFASYLAAQKMQHQGNRHWVDIPMVREHKVVSAKGFGPAIERAANRYQISPALILAVIDTESSFNPFAVSPSKAYGLMQVMSRTAGRDVYEKIYKRSGQPDRSVLLNPDKNIDIGTAYLSILRDNYLRGVQGALKQEYCIIAAYNGGTGNLLKAFHSDRKRAVQRINAMSAEEVFQTIVRSHPKAESRNYLKKVTKAKARYAS